MFDRVMGGLVGFAIGDAMGVTTEFMSPEEIKERFGEVREILGGGVFGFDCGETSDDTAMTIAVAKGIIANSENPIEEMGKQFMKWRNTRPKDIGITIAATFRNYQGDWFQAAEATDRDLGMSGGNGTLMRCLPIALAYSNTEKIDKISTLQSKMTHQEDAASEACVLYNRIAKRLLQGEELKGAIAAEIKNTEYDLDYRKKPDCPPSGYVVHSLKWVFYWLLNKNSFQDVIIGAVNMGNDSDTIAAIAGGLKGLEVGYSKLPAKHVNKLQDLNILEELAEVICVIRDKDTSIIQENQAEYLQELSALTIQSYELAEQGDPSLAMMKPLKEKMFLYRAALREDENDFIQKYEKWRKVQNRLKRSQRLLDLGAPAIIIQHELDWLRLEAEHLKQIHSGIEPQYTNEELDELESLRQLELDMDKDMKDQGFIE